ncbi:RNA 3'-terminal phosphate cyclase-domain-containing protein [Echria macrotheca]|uniref:RNA 3'-terminal phosphate cyclase-domain-containing protein n=1 Tax=Echria macrotheca TaxID=438768 RepID=A0AAJ0BIT8_9PEZI|nr:RNA 3'-terminal phosphate cyclase-domain-containing protein [Echria macrotheca]
MIVPSEKKENMKELKVIELDGRTGEGGGQLVRIACALASVVGQPIKINHVRGNREGPRGGGLKAQHVSALTWLAKATDAETSGIAVGSQTVEFRPREGPATSRLLDWSKERANVKIAADSAAASTLLIFQAVFPFLLYAGNEKGESITIEISGGTNVSYSLSFEYLDQVLMPMLETFFGIRVDRTLHSRGWSQGKLQRGTVTFTIYPLKLGEPLKPRPLTFTPDDREIETIDMTIIAPTDMHEPLRDALLQDLSDLFPGVELNVHILEDSESDSRVYVLLVAHSAGGLRFGRDILSSVPKAAPTKSSSRSNNKNNKSGANASVSTAEKLARKVSKELFNDCTAGGIVDEYLQDQLVIFQALAEGQSWFPRTGSAGQDVNTNGSSLTIGTKKSLDDAIADLNLGSSDDQTSSSLRREQTTEPFGEGSTHAQTARWVVSLLLPGVKWFNEGKGCEGVGKVVERPLK